MLARLLRKSRVWCVAHHYVIFLYLLSLLNVQLASSAFKDPLDMPKVVSRATVSTSEQAKSTASASAVLRRYVSLSPVAGD